MVYRFNPHSHPRHHPATGPGAPGGGTQSNATCC